MEQDESSPNKDKTPKRKPKIPKVRKVNFEGFKNRFSEEEDIYALDVLVAGDDLADEIHREIQTRQSFGHQNPGYSEENNNSRRKQTKKASSVFDQANRDAIPKAASSPKWVAGSGECGFNHSRFSIISPRLWARRQDEGRLGRAGIEMGGERKPGAQVDKSKAVEDREANTLDNEESIDARAASIEALRDVRCYVKFVDDEIAPLARQFEGTAHKKIRFDDLWFLFKVGDVVCTPGGMVPAISGSKSSVMYQPLWRICSLDCPSDPSLYPADERTLDPRRPIPSRHWPDLHGERPRQSYMGDRYYDYEKDENEGREGQFRVRAYYIDHNGASYGSVEHCMTILRYQGEEQMTSLPCYPLRYLDDWEIHLEELKERGRKFESCMKNNHWSYNGWTLNPRPDGAPMPVNSSSLSQYLQSEYIDSHVVVDFAEAFHQVPDWRPAFHHPMTSEAPWQAKADQVVTVTWSDQERSKLVSTADDICQNIDGVANLQRNDGLKRDSFLKASKKLPLNSGGHTPILLQDEDYALLSRRMFVYVLNDRKFRYSVLERDPNPAQRVQEPHDREGIPADGDRGLHGLPREERPRTHPRQPRRLLPPRETVWYCGQCGLPRPSVSKCRVWFPAARPGPMAYGYSESHGGSGTNVYQTPAHPRAGLSPGPLQTPPIGVAQGRPGLDPFTTDASQQTGLW